LLVGSRARAGAGRVLTDESVKPRAYPRLGRGRPRREDPRRRARRRGAPPAGRPNGRLPSSSQGRARGASTPRSGPRRRASPAGWSTTGGSATCCRSLASVSRPRSASSPSSATPVAFEGRTRAGAASGRPARARQAARSLPGPPAGAEGVAPGAADQVAHQDVLDPVAQACSLGDQGDPGGDPPAQDAGGRIGLPDRPQVVGRQEFGQRGGVDREIDDGPGVGRRSSTTWSSGPSVAANASRLSGEAPIRPPERVRRPGSTIATSATWRPTSSPMLRMAVLLSINLGTGRHDNNGSGLVGHPGQSQGRPENSADSWSISTAACPSGGVPILAPGLVREPYRRGGTPPSYTRIRSARPRAKSRSLSQGAHVSG
jgi:hypothetical protein